MYRILVVDDDASVRVSIRWMLEQDGHSVQEAEGAKKAIELLKGRACDLMITDILMPEMDGLELMAVVQDLYPGMKIIAISGGGFFCGGSLYSKMSLNCGATRFLEKPFSQDQVLQEVREVIWEGRLCANGALTQDTCEN